MAVGVVVVGVVAGAAGVVAEAGAAGSVVAEAGGVVPVAGAVGVLWLAPVTTEVTGAAAEVTAEMAEPALVVAEAGADVVLAVASGAGVALAEPDAAGLADAAGVADAAGLAEPVFVAGAVAGVAAEPVLVAEEAAGAAAAEAADVAEPLLAELPVAELTTVLAALVTAAGRPVPALVVGAVVDVTSEVSVAVLVTAELAGAEVADGVAACACRENISKTTRIPAARTAPCTARRATWRNTSCMSSSPRSGQTRQR